MPYEILASVCQHRIRTSSTLPWSGTNLDFDIQYCNSCQNSRHIRSERDRSEREYHAAYLMHDLLPDQYPCSSHRERRREYDDARLAYAEDLQYQQDRDDHERRRRGERSLRDQGRSFTGLDDPEWLAFSRRMTGHRETRFEAPERHRRESQYRDQRAYRRSSSRYRRGTHADASGYGYYNTSDPYADGYADEGYSRGGDAELDRMSSRDLDEYMRRLQRSRDRYHR